MTWQFYPSFKFSWTKYPVSDFGAGPDVTLYDNVLIVGPFQFRWWSNT